MSKLAIYLVCLPALVFLVIFMSLKLLERERVVERPASIPMDAVQATGSDGGSWARCEYSVYPRLYCETYHSEDGAIWTRGNYVLAKNAEQLDTHDEIPIDEMPVDEMPIDEIPADEIPIDDLMARFSLFDGKYIYLEPGTRLVPDGVIDSPFRSQGGKRTVYSMGKVVTAERQYR